MNRQLLLVTPLLFVFLISPFFSSLVKGGWEEVYRDYKEILSCPLIIHAQLASVSPSTVPFETVRNNLDPQHPHVFTCRVDAKGKRELFVLKLELGVKKIIKGTFPSHRTTALILSGHTLSFSPETAKESGKIHIVTWPLSPGPSAKAVLTEGKTYVFMLRKIKDSSFYYITYPGDINNHLYYIEKLFHILSDDRKKPIDFSLIREQRLRKELLSYVIDNPRVPVKTQSLLRWAWAEAIFPRETDTSPLHALAVRKTLAALPVFIYALESSEQDIRICAALALGPPPTHPEEIKVFPRDEKGRPCLNSSSLWIAIDDETVKPRRIGWQRWWAEVQNKYQKWRTKHKTAFDEVETAVLAAISKGLTLSPLSPQHSTIPDIRCLWKIRYQPVSTKRKKNSIF